MNNISKTDTWIGLGRMATDPENPPLAALFSSDADRAQTFSASACDLYLDYSRQRIAPNVRDGLLALADETDALGFLKRMAAGEALNNTEGRAVLHTACRGTPAEDASVDEAVAETDARLASYVTEVHDSGRFSAAIAIGIGGSELGPALVVDALRDGYDAKMDVRFCGNIDGIAFDRATRGLDPKRTLVVVVSKSFGTLETSMNAAKAKEWMQAGVGADWAENFAVVSANLDATGAFGVDDARVFPMWDYVGGRYSVWSAVGLPIALAYGWGAFQDFRSGARDMDVHALSATPAQNVPLLMGLITVWNASFLGYQAEACVPYDTRLNLLVSHLQQLQMESNGKRVTNDGDVVDYATQPVVFGGVGTNVQHAFFQQLHQGTTEAPVDILVPAAAPSGPSYPHDDLVANAFAQADALAFGDANTDNPHKHYPGNRPSSVLLYRTLDASVMGQLIALYEHKTAFAGAIWGINSFDQWGVELGKRLSGPMRDALTGDAAPSDASAPLVDAFKSLNRGS